AFGQARMRDDGEIAHARAGGVDEVDRARRTGRHRRLPASAQNGAARGHHASGEDAGGAPGQKTPGAGDAPGLGEDTIGAVDEGETSAGEQFRAGGREDRSLRGAMHEFGTEMLVEFPKSL